MSEEKTDVFKCPTYENEDPPEWNGEYEDPYDEMPAPPAPKAAAAAAGGEEKIKTTAEEAERLRTMLQKVNLQGIIPHAPLERQLTFFDYLKHFLQVLVGVITGNPAPSLAELRQPSEVPSDAIPVKPNREEMIKFLTEEKLKIGDYEISTKDCLGYVAPDGGFRKLKAGDTPPNGSELLMSRMTRDEQSGEGKQTKRVKRVVNAAMIGDLMPRQTSGGLDPLTKMAIAERLTAGLLSSAADPAPAPAAPKSQEAAKTKEESPTELMRRMTDELQGKKAEDLEDVKSKLGSGMPGAFSNAEQARPRTTAAVNPAAVASAAPR